MKDMKKLLAMAAIAVSVFALEARTFEVAVWRGETTAVRVPDFADFGKVPDGLKIRFGVMKTVKYSPSPESLQRLEVYDRVKWGSDDAGPRVVEVTAPADATPGVYACGNLSIRVVDRVLPPAKDWKYYLDLWQHPWAVARYFEVEPFSKKHYRKMRPVYELLATAGQKTITVPILDQPWNHQCFDAYHSMIGEKEVKVEGEGEQRMFDFSLFDEYVQFCLDCGLGPYISCYSLCPWTLGAAIDADELEKRWGTFLDRFAAHLKEKGWYDQTLMSMDERAPEDVRKVVDFVHRHAPGMRISMAGNRKPSDFKGIDIDIYSQVLSHVTDDFLAEVPARRAKGFITTHYVCCWPIHPNTFMSSGPGEAFWLGAYPAMCGLDGFLRWAWNSWPMDPEEDASYDFWRAGDTFLCYPEGEPSWRFLELRNGIVAAEKVRLLKERGLFTDEISKLAARYKAGEAVEGKSDYAGLRAETLDVVNREGPYVKTPGAAQTAATRRHTGIPSLAVSPKNGRLWVCFYGGVTPGEDSNNYVTLMTSADRGKTWTPALVADPDGPGPKRTFDSELWVSPDGLLRWTFTERVCKLAPVGAAYDHRYAGDIGDPKTDRLMCVTLNAEETPSAPFPQPREIGRGVMMCKPTVLQDGSCLLPVAHWYEAPSACFLATTDGWKTFAARGGITLPKEHRLFDEHVVTQLGNGDLLSFIRAKWNVPYYESVSHDAGRTWEPAKPARFAQTSSRVFLKRLASGAYLLVKNGAIDRDEGRSRLQAYVSRDDGATWHGGLMLDDRTDVSYPDGDQAADGTIYVTYDRNRMDEQEILFAAFTEADAWEGKVVDPSRVRLRGLVTSRP